ncbi:MAG: methionine--tRNA ligase [Candidatus Yanofskybacteria bacterium CG10_big_fil_rev_8_21_14_0_10_46_23]|uniref:Methionine--tRNA ligase n=1 Tax=Candidatus Yanofskybacteria bacterium CG10_big_fil_rev_8_21_14_0_10_46_23 TaxID=1975098 RepID=A0A2H0R3J3_9BACT|nr:MAG: methionine--tRNA ligase [Candidatus Yanofskybacteria bacterium CG10_big_fil_rev_8_21_14_0_10_46_23]
MSKERFYITTTLPYVNAEPHIGFALEIVQADVLARFARSQGKEVFFNTGTDEHGLKIYRKAQEAGQESQAYVDEYAVKFDELKTTLNVSYDHFIRTTAPQHIKAAQEIWRRVATKGDIYKKNYKIKYCVGCELEKTDSDLENGCCPIHPNQPIEIIEEENYFFRFSKYQSKLLELYEKQPDFILPTKRLNEIKKFVAGGLADFSISRLRAKMPWGVPVPDDAEHVMYVWFDALVSYISTLDWPENEDRFKQFWPGLQIAGKDNLRQQAAIWQAMLLSADLPSSKQILIHGFITSEGQKMSKSLGNVVSPKALVDQFGVDPVRYFLLREIPSDEDGDFSLTRLKERYTSDLAHGLGNLVQRVSTLITDDLGGQFILSSPGTAVEEKIASVSRTVEVAIKNFRLHEALAQIWTLIDSANSLISDRKPWEFKEESEKFARALNDIVALIKATNDLLAPFIPETTEKIEKVFNFNQGAEIKVSKGKAIFPALE